MWYREGMDDATRTRVLARAEDLLPRYGGFVEGAVNQALLLLGVFDWTPEDYDEVCAELKARQVAVA